MNIIIIIGLSQIIHSKEQKKIYFHGFTTFYLFRGNAIYFDEFLLKSHHIQFFLFKKHNSDDVIKIFIYIPFYFILFFSNIQTKEK